MILVGIDIANCAAIREEASGTRGGQDPATERGHRARPQSSGARPVSVGPALFSKLGEEEDKTRTQSRATEFRGAAKRRTRGGQETDKRSTRGGQDLDTEPGHRARPHSSGARPRQGQEEDKTRTQSRATEFRGAASECGQPFCF